MPAARSWPKGFEGTEWPVGFESPGSLTGKRPGLWKLLKEEAKRNVLPVGGQTAASMGGRAAGTALAAALAPESAGLSLALPLVMGAGAAGLENIAANKLLPESVGGSPKQSALSSFMWGAGPEALLGTPAAVMEGRALRTGKAAVEEGTKQFEKQIGARGVESHKTLADALKGSEPTLADVQQTTGLLGRPTGRAVATGDARMQQTFALRDATLGPINRLRKRLGEPIGKAYDALKGSTQPADVTGLRQSVQDIRQSMLSPISPSTNQLLDRVAAMEPEPLLDRAVGLPGGEVFVPGRRQPSALEAALGGRNTLPTLDAQRELRQLGNAQLRSAKGGDVHALASLQQILDEKLLPHLPDDIGGLKARYKSFIDLYPWRDVNALGRAPTPADIGKFVFGRKPEQALEIIQNASPAERATLKSAFADHALADVDPNLPAAAQMKAIREGVQPYIRNGVVKQLYGTATQDLRNIIYLPLHREQYAKALASPQGQKLFAAGFKEAARQTGKTEMEAAQAGMQRFIESLPVEAARCSKRCARKFRLANHCRCCCRLRSWRNRG
jgi:hypothetical protein